ncbi:hypothetical protein HDV05_002342 [Chytridiales sp. JEL 0842]|nr:hypothetical protein HDV05_002342 [Chytridiales sp. JEL 0842]
MSQNNATQPSATLDASSPVEVAAPPAPSTTDLQPNTVPPPGTPSVVEEIQTTTTTPTTTTEIEPTASTTTTRSTPTPTSLNGYPYPDPDYDTNASGLVTVLLLNSQGTGPHGDFLQAAGQALTASTTFNPPTTNNTADLPATPPNKPIKVDLRSFPESTDYDTYAKQVRQSCDAGVRGLFDVVMVEASYAGMLGDCLVDLNTWDLNLEKGFRKELLAASTVNNRLVTLPYEADYGILAYNQDILNRHDQSGPVTNFDEFENMLEKVLKAERSIDHFVLSGLASDFSGENLATSTFEWLYGNNRTTLFVNKGNTTVSIANNMAAEVLSRVAAWTGNNIIDTKDIGPNPNGLEEVDPYEYALERFLNERSVFWKGWASSIPYIQERQPGFRWGLSPVFGIDVNTQVGAVGGWGLGVYRHTENPRAAVKLIKYLTSTEVQKQRVVQFPLKAFPTREELATDHSICSQLGSDALNTPVCDVLYPRTPTVRPVDPAGVLYKDVARNVSKSMINILEGTYIVTALQSLEADIKMGLNTTATNSTIDTGIITNKPRNAVSHLGEQVAGLFFVVFVTGIVVFLMKKRKDQMAEMERRKAQGLGPDGGNGGRATEMVDNRALEASKILSSIKGGGEYVPPPQPPLKSVKVKNGFQAVSSYADDEDLEAGNGGGFVEMYDADAIGAEEDLQGKKVGLGMLGAAMGKSSNSNAKAGGADSMNESMRSFEKADFV